MADLKTVAPPNNKKRIAVFLDGTTDTSMGNTNVWRARSLCAPFGTDGVEQRIYYSAGVGTRMGERARGMVFGYGIDDQVIEAYEWLVENYEKNDDIFIFGFSRGAYAARSLSGYISRCGLIRPGSPLGVKQLYDRYRKGGAVLTIHELLEPQRGSSAFKLEDKLEEKWMIKDCEPAPVKFTGVWDTVGSVPLTNGLALLTGGNHAFLDTNLRRTEQTVYHATAIDEFRIDFDVTLLTDYVPKSQTGPFVSPRELKDVEQRWFAGAHGDVGGGSYSDPLAQVPLKWLLSKASGQGLAFRRDIEIDDEAATGRIEDSFSNFLGGAYKVLRFEQRHYRAIDRPPVVLNETTVHPINETIDKSVFERYRRGPAYRPNNLLDWAKRHSVDVDTLTTSVQASNPSQPAPD
jgi:uncharacterized protein (DUF2235 family)